METEDALSTGVLGGNEHCLWIDSHDGSRAALVMPAGTSVETRLDRIVLVVDGSEVATEGQWVAVGGGVGATPDCASDADFGLVVGQLSVCEVQAAICESEEE